MSDDNETPDLQTIVEVRLSEWRLVGTLQGQRSRVPRLKSRLFSTLQHVAVYLNGTSPSLSASLTTCPPAVCAGHTPEDIDLNAATTRLAPNHSLLCQTQRGRLRCRAEDHAARCHVRRPTERSAAHAAVERNLHGRHRKVVLA